MATEIKLWQIADDTLKPIDSLRLNLESRLEEWLSKDIDLVNDNLLVIGQQVPTPHTGGIDLLAMDAEGNLVILELKRDRTPRDVVAQTLDYASWVKDLGRESVEKIASEFLGGNATLEQAFKERFGADLPEAVNENHRMYIVASRQDSRTERIVEYLSETHGVDINFASFNYFKTADGVELVGRSMLIDEEVVQARTATRTGKRPKPNATQEEIRDMAYNKGVGELFDKAFKGLHPLVNTTGTSQTTLALKTRAVPGTPLYYAFSLIPLWSSPESGLAIRMNDVHISACFGVSVEKIAEVCGPAVESIPGVAKGHLWGLVRLFDPAQIDDLIKLIADAKTAKDRK